MFVKHLLKPILFLMKTYHLQFLPLLILFHTIPDLSDALKATCQFKCITGEF